MLKESEVRKNVEFALRKFAESLKCPEEYCTEGRQLVNKVRRKIAEKTIFSVGAIRYGGSVGKNTDVIAPDFDVVVAVNGETPPFKHVLDDFHDILLLHEDELKIQRGSLGWHGEFSLKFTFDNGIKVDLLPACNLPLENIRRKMLKDKKESRRYSSSLVEEAVEFMKTQDGFTHSVVRLAKFWFKSCHFAGEYIYGGSTMIELISVAASLKELEMEEKSELRVLTRVIEMVRGIDKLKIAFKMNSRGEWELIPENILNREEVAFGKWGMCNRATLQRKYYLIEPTNPLNDLLRNRSPNLIEKLKKFAGVTKQRLDDFWLGKYIGKDNAGQTSVQFEKLFEPQPSNLQEEFPTGVPSLVQVRSENSYPSLDPHMKVINEKVMERLEVKGFLRVFKWHLISAAKASQTGEFSEQTVYSAVKNQIETSLQVKFGPPALREDVDISIWVPFRVDGGIQAVRINLIWE